MSTDVLNEDLLRRFDQPGPRYTSYPTADRFHDGFGADELLGALAQRADAGAAAPPLSLYVHVPFCASVCYYCACNKVITRHHERAAPYLDDLEREIALYTSALGSRAQPVAQLHLGGGSPTFLSDAELERLVVALHRAFRIGPATEMAIEVDPRTVTPQRLARLRALGFDRLSFGVQDVDPAVQQAVHRVQPFEQVRELVLAARELGFGSINADLIYGLPKQTPQSFERTVAQIGRLAPDRIALYAYAHLPARFKPQRRIVAAELPTAPQRVAMLGGAIAGFLARGYQYIGMDHFALPGDALAVARREGRLQRNFQGYSAMPDGDLIALGVSAIGRIGKVYAQNAKTLPEYHEALAAGRLPIVRGHRLDAEDGLRRDVVMALMCRGRFDFDAIGRRHGVDLRAHLAAELARLAPLADEGLVMIEPDGVRVTAAGWYLVRAIAAVFDAYLPAAAADRARFSKMV